MHSTEGYSTSRVYSHTTTMLCCISCKHGGVPIDLLVLKHVNCFTNPAKLFTKRTYPLCKLVLLPSGCTELLDKESPPPQPLPTLFVKLMCPLLLRLPLSAAIPTQSQTTTIYCGNSPSILCCVRYKSHITV